MICKIVLKKVTDEKKVVIPKLRLPAVIERRAGSLYLINASGNRYYVSSIEMVVPVLMIGSIQLPIPSNHMMWAYLHRGKHARIPHRNANQIKLAYGESNQYANTFSDNLYIMGLHLHNRKQ